MLEYWFNNIPEIEITVIDFSKKKYKEQVEIFKSADIFLGVHGNAFSNTIHLSRRTVVIEIFPFQYPIEMFRQQ
eukprot:Pgem_evm1s18179